MGHKKSVVVWLINSKTLFFSHLPRVPPSESFDLSRAGEEMRAFTKSSAENQSWSVCGVCKGARQCGRGLVTTSVIGMRFPPDSGTICDLVYLIHLFHYYLFHKTESISLKKKNKRKKKSPTWREPRCWFQRLCGGRKQEPLHQRYVNPLTCFFFFFFFSCAINEKSRLDCTPSNINQWEPTAPGCTIGCT